MKITYRDRHGEHVDDSVPLCEHGDYDLVPGDKFTVKVLIGTATVAEVELLLDKKDEMTLIVNQLDYLIEKAKRE